MKTLKQLIKQKPLFLELFQDKESVRKEFEVLDDENWVKTNILFAFYDYEDYSGDAFILFEKEGNLYEINAGHCSCFGLEDQWTAEVCELKALQDRIVKGSFGQYGGFREQLKEFLGIS